MKEYIIGKNEAGQRFDKYLSKLLSNAPKSFIYKMLRKKNIVLNGKKSEGNEITSVGDSVKLFLSEETIKEFSAEGKKIDIKPVKIHVDVVYEDDHVVFFNKPVGILSQRAEKDDVSMNEILIDYLLKKGELTEEQLKTFKPSTVNRLDRNTSGLIMAGKDLAGSQQLSEALRSRTFKKEYVCLVKGYIDKAIHLNGALTKDNRSNKVKISDDGDEKIITDISPLAKGDNCTLLLVHLVTGKPHQIRAHLSSINHPIYGDNKYGDIQLNKKLNSKYSLKSQLLHAWRVSFGETEGPLSGLNKKTIYASVPDKFKKVLKGENVEWQPGQDED